jgi:hypothetical protein
MWFYLSAYLGQHSEQLGTAGGKLRVLAYNQWLAERHMLMYGAAYSM